MGKRVSIIVPVYRVEAYIDECVESLVSQTYSNLEILLIDDESPDNCGAICDRWAARDSRIRVIHKKNGGAASARNAGLDAATGDYVCFVDSDDAVLADYVCHLVSTLETQRADAAVCGFSFWNRENCKTVGHGMQPGVYARNEYLLGFLREWSCSLLWNKIFRREAVGTIRMAEGHRVDDEFFTYQVCMNCKTVAVTDRCLYQYRLRASSVMQNAAPAQERMMLDRIEYVTERYGNIAERIPELEEAFFRDALDTIVRYWHHSKQMPEAQARIRTWTNTYFRQILSMKGTLRVKVGYLYSLYWKKPAITAETNTIQVEQSLYFD